MRHGTEYAKRVKRLFHRLVRQHGKPAPAEPTDPLEQLIAGILSACTTMARGRAVFRRLCQDMVDLNELRVTPAMELAETIGDAVPLAGRKAQRIVNVLNDVRRRQDKLDLSFLRQRGRREAREYLESLAGVDRSAAASVVLFSLGGHAIPVDDLSLYILRKEELVDPAADAAEVQGFLERHISAANAQAFAELLGRYVASKGARVAVEELPRLLSPPPPAPTPVPAPLPTPSAEKPPAKPARQAQTAGKQSVSQTPAATRKPTTTRAAQAPQDGTKKVGQR